MTENSTGRSNQSGNAFIKRPELIVTQFDLRSRNIFLKVLDRGGCTGYIGYPFEKTAFEERRSCCQTGSL